MYIRKTLRQFGCCRHVPNTFETLESVFHDDRVTEIAASFTSAKSRFVNFPILSPVSELAISFALDRDGIGWNGDFTRLSSAMDQAEEWNDENRATVTSEISSPNRGCSI